MKKLKLGTVKINTGQLVIVDPSYLEDWVGGEFNVSMTNDPTRRDPKSQLYDNHYDEVCNVTFRKGYGQVFDKLAVAFQTYWGNGEAEIYGEFDEDTGRPTRIIIELE